MRPPRPGSETYAFLRAALHISDDTPTEFKFMERLLLTYVAVDKMTPGGITEGILSSAATALGSTVADLCIRQDYDEEQCRALVDRLAAEINESVRQYRADPVVRMMALKHHQKEE